MLWIHVDIKKINALTHFVECFQNDMTLHEYDLIIKENVSDAQECQETFCQDNNKCTAFVYNFDTNLCLLKQPPAKFLGIVQLKKEEGNVFGPKYCPGIFCSWSKSYLTVGNINFH